MTEHEEETPTKEKQHRTPYDRKSIWDATDVTPFGQWLLTEIEQRNFHHKAFYTQAGLWPNRFYKLLRGKTELTLPDLHALSDVLEMDPQVLIEKYVESLDMTEKVKKQAGVLSFLHTYLYDLDEGQRRTTRLFARMQARENKEKARRAARARSSRQKSPPPAPEKTEPELVSL